MKQQPIHIGNLQAIRPYISLDKQPSPVMVPSIYYDPTNKTVTAAGTKLRPSYPLNTKAFLYYSTSSDRPRIAGELRLRLTSCDDPASFESGSDLLLTNGRLWSRPLHYLQASNLYSLLYEKLREELLVPDDLDAALSALPSLCPRYHRRNHLLYTLNDEFIVDFGIWGMELFVITEQGAERLRLLELFSDRRKRSKAIFYRAYTGGYANHPISTLLY